MKAKFRAKAARAFTRYTQNAVTELKNDEDKMLKEVNLCRKKHEPCISTQTAYSIRILPSVGHFYAQVGQGPKQLELSSDAPRML